MEAKLDYGFDWTRQFTRLWEPDKPYDTGIALRPAGDPTGFQYRNLGADGQSGANEPTWPRTNGGTVTDGSITWTAESYSVDALLDQIDTDTWTADSTALIVEPQPPVNAAGLQQTVVVLSEGVAGQTYEIENEVFTLGGYEYVARLYLTVTD